MIEDIDTTSGTMDCACGATNVSLYNHRCGEEITSYLDQKTMTPYKKDAKGNWRKVKPKHIHQWQLVSSDTMHLPNWFKFVCPDCSKVKVVKEK